MEQSDEDQVVTAGDIADDEALRRMYRISAERERSFDDKLHDLLALGRSYLGVEAGFLTEISEGQQFIIEAIGDHPLLQAGASCPLSKAYCRKTIEQELAMTVQHASVEGWEGDAAYEEFGLESYIGAKVVVDGDVYGTFCFADSRPRADPFSQQEETFVELMAEWVGYELTQQRATERIREQRDRLEEFADIVSHDLRNPINVMEGYLELAEDTGEASHFDQCWNALDRMKDIIDDMLILAREGQAIDEIEEVELANLIQECWETVQTTEATIRVTNEQVIRADPSRLKQLFENLFRNAVEHADSAVEVTVCDLENGFYVEDDGPGIPEEHRQEVFSPGYSTSEEGTGFGLSIVQEIADGHGWELELTSGTTGGTRFEFTGIEPD